jgi:hypothetical protein
MIDKYLLPQRGQRRPSVKQTKLNQCKNAVQEQKLLVWSTTAMTTFLYFLILL